MATAVRRSCPRRRKPPLYAESKNGLNGRGQPFAGLTSESDRVINLSAGGHVRVLRDRDLHVHAGVGGNRSPVGAHDDVFNEVDLLTWTLGLSGSLGKFQFSAGINRQFGQTQDITLRNLLNGQVVRSAINVGMTGFIYSLGYQF